MAGFLCIEEHYFLVRDLFSECVCLCEKERAMLRKPTAMYKEDSGLKVLSHIKRAVLQSGYASPETSNVHLKYSTSKTSIRPSVMWYFRNDTFA